MNIYFCGSMTGSRDKQENYEEIIDYLKNYGEVLNEFVADKQVTDYSPSHVFDRDYNNMHNSDICIADISLPSTGVGFELGIFHELNVPTLLLYDINFPSPSTLPRGSNHFIVNEYKDIKEEKELIKIFIKNLNKTEK